MAPCSSPLRGTTAPHASPSPQHIRKSSGSLQWTRAAAWLGFPILGRVWNLPPQGLAWPPHGLTAKVSFSGTSASAPLVSGAIAGLLSQDSKLTPKEALELLTQNANDGYAIGKDPRLGHGVVNLNRVLNGAHGASTTSQLAGTIFPPPLPPAVTNPLTSPSKTEAREWLSGSSLTLTVGTKVKRFQMGSMKRPKP